MGDRSPDLRIRIGSAIDAIKHDGKLHWEHIDLIIEAIGLSEEALSWVSAHPEAAKGLAEGRMVAASKGRKAWDGGSNEAAMAPVIERLIEGVISVCEPENVDDKARATTRMALRRRFKRILRSPPAPRDEAQGETT